MHLSVVRSVLHLTSDCGVLGGWSCQRYSHAGEGPERGEATATGGLWFAV